MSNETMPGAPGAAGGEPRRSPMNRRTFTEAAIGVAAVGIAASLTGWSAARHADEGEREESHFSRRIVAPRISGAVPRDPGDPAWAKATPIRVTLLQQTMVEPNLKLEGMIPAIELKALHNGSELGFLVSWEDPNSSDVEAASRFRDSVAVQLPVNKEGPVGVVMGQPGRPVHLLHWRASWQRAIASGTGTVRDAFPNAVSDVSPEDVMKEDHARTFYPAQVAGNAMALRKRTSPVEELVAEGLGSITSQGEQRAEGKGAFSGARWDVAIVVPMQGRENQASLRPGDRTAVAAAVWNGGKGDRGARKQFADWSGLELEA